MFRSPSAIGPYYPGGMGVVEPDEAIPGFQYFEIFGQWGYISQGRENAIAEHDWRQLQMIYCSFG